MDRWEAEFSTFESQATSSRTVIPAVSDTSGKVGFCRGSGETSAESASFVFENQCMPSLDDVGITEETVRNLLLCMGNI